MQRYSRNGILTTNEQDALKDKKILIAGCGGLGGYILEMLARIGLGSITAVDGDVFDESNLNRQLLSTVDNLGKSKALAAYERVMVIDPSIHITVIADFINESNVDSILMEHDIVIDALDSNATRTLVMDTCKKLGIVYVYGAIAGWYGQVGVAYPEDNALRNYVESAVEKGIETQIGNPSFTPACIAGFQVSQVLKVLLNKDGVLRDKLLYIDMLDNEFQIIDLT